MANEVVDDQVVDSGEGAEGQEGNNVEGQDGGTSGGGEGTQIDPEAYADLQKKVDLYEKNWSKLQNITNTDSVFRKELERAWKGLPPEQKAAIQTQAKVQSNRQSTNDNLSKQEVEALKQQIEEIRTFQQTQQQTVAQSEKLREVQDETDRTFKQFEATPADQVEFWKRYDSMIKNEAQKFMSRGIPLQQAMSNAIFNHSFNIAGEYASLMVDKVGEFTARKAQERKSPLRGLMSPADKVQGNGATPSVVERFLNTVRNEKDATKRAQMYLDFSQESGIPVNDLFRSRGGI